MSRNILLSSNNEGKLKRFRMLLESAGMDIKIVTPREAGIKEIHIEETAETLAENAELKARAYFGKTEMPILANDTGFWVEGEGFVIAPKRIALPESNTTNLTQDEIADHMLTFWKNIATKHGSSVPAAWIESFVLLLPDGTTRVAESRRDVILTDTVFGVPHAQLPIRALYISVATGKPALSHTKEEELLEMTPVAEALKEVLT